MELRRVDQSMVMICAPEAAEVCTPTMHMSSMLCCKVKELNAWTFLGHWPPVWQPTDFEGMLRPMQAHAP